MSPKSQKTSKQITAAKKRRSSTLKKLDKLSKKIDALDNEAEKERQEWRECIHKIYDLELSVTKKEWAKMKKPCEQKRKKFTRMEKTVSQLNNKAIVLEEIAGDIEEMYGIPEKAPY